MQEIIKLVALILIMGVGSVFVYQQAKQADELRVSSCFKNGGQYLEAPLFRPFEGRCLRSR